RQESPTYSAALWPESLWRRDQGEEAQARRRRHRGRAKETGRSPHSFSRAQARRSHIMLTRKRTIAAKIETVAGTPESLTASDGAVNVYNLAINANIAMEQREGQGGFGYLSSVPGGRVG